MGGFIMKVTLINGEELQKNLELAGWQAKVSYNSKTPNEKVAKKCIESGHGTPTRGTMRFIFELEEVSRACTHEIVRHHEGFYPVQRSQRYVNEDGFKYVKPSFYDGNVFIGVTIPDDKSNHLISFDELQSIIEQFYSNSIVMGAKPEDARYALTNATHSKIRVSLSWEGLIHFCELRCCSRAQWEIRQVAYAMIAEVKKYSVYLANQLGAKCTRAGYCTEDNSCGAFPKKEEVLEGYKHYKELKDKESWRDK
jgi:thymidylate synthase (FAD)